MTATQIITRYAAKPFKAEHPIGSNTIVEYKPGDVVPAGDWGPAESWLKESGKIFEGVTIVYTDDEDLPVSAVQQLAVKEYHNDGSVPSGPLVEAPGEPVEEGFPQHIGFGNYRLSTGENIKGQENAHAAQAVIDNPRHAEHVVTPEVDPSQFPIESFPISRPGGQYLLSNGELVSGRDHAKEVQAALLAEAEEAAVVDGEFPQHAGAGWYFLSDGTKLRGKAKAIAAEAALGGTDA